MAYDVKIMGRAIEKHKAIVSNYQNEILRRRQRIMSEIPRIADIDKRLKTSVIRVINTALRQGEDAETKILSIKDENLELQRERAELLTLNGYPFNYLSDAPMCELCDDTGFIGSKMCNCLEKIYRAEQTAELSSTLGISGCTFDDFSFDYYETKIDTRIGASPRDNMAYIFDTCADFAGSFKRHSDNLFMQGTSGLGKTFLAACIANEVISRGASVVYESSCNIFSRFEDDKFRHDEETTALDIRRYMTCDLLILDDLGTETSSQFNVSALYNLMNTRRINKKQCIIITNLTSDELRKRYSPQIMSRLEGDYTPLYFFGEDIRKKRRQ